MTLKRHPYFFRPRFLGAHHWQITWRSDTSGHNYIRAGSNGIDIEVSWHHTVSVSNVQSIEVSSVDWILFNIVILGSGYQYLFRQLNSLCEDFQIYTVVLCPAYISQPFVVSRVICRLTTKVVNVRLLKQLSFVVQTNTTKVWPIRKLNRPDFCCQCTCVQKHLSLNCTLDHTTFVVATSQSQRVAFISRGSAAVTYAVTNNGGMAEWRPRSRFDSSDMWQTRPE